MPMNVEHDRAPIIRCVFTAWVIVWLVLIVVLILFWWDISPWISWPLAIIEAIFVPDIRNVRKYVLRR